MQDQNAHLFVQTYKKKPLVVDKGDGTFFQANNGKKYLDFLSGIAINNLGYGNAAIKDRITKQLDKIIHPSNYYYTDVQIKLAEKLIKTSGLDKVFYANSGTEANEACLTFLQAYSKSVNKNEIIVLEGSFFGRTYGASILATGGNFYGLKITTVPFNDADTLQKAISEKTLAIGLELVLGHGGIKAADSAVIDVISAKQEQYGTVVMVDEVQTGLGRTGSLFRFQKLGLKPDLVTLGKSLGGGLPLSTALVSGRIAKLVQPGSYGCTMGGNSLACAAGLAILETLEDSKTLEKINEKSTLLHKKLTSLFKNYPHIIKDVRCFGLMCGLELKDTETAVSVVSACLENGLLVDVVNKNTIRIAPPFTVSDEEIAQAESILQTVFSSYEV